METRICYKFDKKTNEFLHTTYAFQEPVGKTFPLPSFSTFVEPPKVEEFQVAVWNEEKWEIKKDYRRHLVQGEYVGGKAYYNPNEYWWANEQYMTEIGDIPEGMSFEKMEKPQIVSDVIELTNEVYTNKQYLSDTDYIHNVIAEEPEKADKYASVIEERKRVRATVDPTEEQIEGLKAQIVILYGKEALNHLY